MRKPALLLSLLALGALGLTACGGGGDDEATAASEADPARKFCRVPRYRLAVNQGDISCHAARRVILDLANNRLPGSWSCAGHDADVVCTKEPGASSRIVITARFASEAAAAAVEADPGTILSDEEVIGRKANEWARLFATDALAACRYYAGGQPACERAACQRVGHMDPIWNCTPPSSEFRKSFANATVERVGVEGRHAVAEFSNGESAQFYAGEYGRWFITKRWIKKITRSHGTEANHRLRIEQMGNEWAALFAKADPTTCGYYDGQPACEREDCTGVGGPIKNCTPPSAEFRESFADATVERVVVEGHHAVAEFSNGESVEFALFRTAGAPGSWGITVNTVKNFER